MNKARWHEYHPKARYDRLNPYDTPLTMPPPPHPDDDDNNDDDDTVSMSTIKPAYAGHTSRAASLSTISSIQTDWTESTPQPQAASQKRHLRQESADTVDSDHALHMQRMHQTRIEQLRCQRKEYEMHFEEETERRKMEKAWANLNKLHQTWEGDKVVMNEEENEEENEDDRLAQEQLLDFF